jgi:hypothetical protein
MCRCVASRVAFGARVANQTVTQERIAEHHDRTGAAPDPEGRVDDGLVRQQAREFAPITVWRPNMAYLSSSG